MKKRLIFLFVTIIMSLGVIAQQVEVKGKVTDYKNKPITATILVKSSKEKVNTDKDGLFTIKCKLKDKLKITAEDHASKTLKVKESGFIEIKLKNTKIDYSAYPSFRDIMISLYSGIVVMEDYKIFFDRKENRFSEHTVNDEPLIKEMKEALLFLDGTEVLASTLINLPTANIKSIKVLRDHNEIVVYGRRGVNGVMLVTTKEK